MPALHDSRRRFMACSLHAQGGTMGKEFNLMSLKLINVGQQSNSLLWWVHRGGPEALG